MNDKELIEKSIDYKAHEENKLMIKEIAKNVENMRIEFAGYKEEYEKIKVEFEEIKKEKIVIEKEVEEIKKRVAILKHEDINSSDEDDD